MELKDVILSTLAEMESDKPQKNIISNPKPLKEAKEEQQKEEEKEEIKVEEESDLEDEQTPNNELFFLKSMRERLLVLFEGFQAPNNTNIEAKIDMTLNFLEYVLVTIDSRVEEIERGKRK